MMGELSFLLEILLNHKLAKPTKDLIAARIRELEERTANTSFIQSINKLNDVPQIIVRPNESAQQIDPAQQNSAVQQALAQRQAAITGGPSGGSIFKVKPKPAPK